MHNLIHEFPSALKTCGITCNLYYLVVVVNPLCGLSKYQQSALV